MKQNMFDNPEKVSPGKAQKYSPKFLMKVTVTGILFLTLFGCQFTQQTSVSPTAIPTTQAPAVQEPPTATATDASLQITQMAMETAQAPATQTQQAREAEATQFVVKLTEDAVAAATAALSAPVMEELAVYGVDKSAGYVAWTHSPVSLSADGYHVSNSANDYADLSVKDFVLAADITWDTKYSESGCGFAFRSNGQDAPNQYRVVLTRSTDGHLFFNAISNGKVANFRDFYVNLLDADFDWNVGAINHLAVVMRGNSIRIYSNQRMVGEVDITAPPPQSPVLPTKPEKPLPPSEDLKGKDLQEAKKAYNELMEEYKDELAKYNERVSKLMNEHNAILNAYEMMDGTFDEGLVEFLAYSSSGSANCQFNNAWLWVIQ